MARLNERVFDRIEEARDTRRRAKVFAFPQQMATLREPLTQFVTDVFDSRQFDGQVLLRGVYFTSGTQEGTPIDRLLGSIGRTLRRDDAVMAAAGTGQGVLRRDPAEGRDDRRVRAGRRQPPARSAQGRGAARRLRGRRADRRRRRARAVGQLQPQPRLPRADRGARSRRSTRCRRSPPTAPLDRIVPRLDAIRAVVDVRRIGTATTTSWPMRWGLYQGASIGNAARDAYMRELDSVLLPRVAVADPRADDRSTRSRAREAVRLSQGLPDARRARAPRQGASADARRPRNGSASAIRRPGPRCRQHFKSVLDEGATLRPVPLDRDAGGAGAQQPPADADGQDPLRRHQAHLCWLRATGSAARSAGRARRRAGVQARSNSRCRRRCPALYARRRSSRSPGRPGGAAEAAVQRRLGLGRRHPSSLQHRGWSPA